MEILLQLILEPMCYAYVEFIENIYIDKKLSKKLEIFLKILCFVLSFIALMFVIIGSIWTTNEPRLKTHGVVLLILGIFVLLVHIIIAIINHYAIKNRQKKYYAKMFIEKDKPTPIIHNISNTED